MARKYFDRLSYDEKLKKCDRPEQIIGPDVEAWQQINAYLETTASSLSELVHQLGIKRFGRIPKVGDVFVGGGSIPFESARIGCDAYGSDLNPVAAMMSWAATHILGGGEEIRHKVEEAQQKVFAAVDKQIEDWGIENNDRGWRSEVLLYCIEAKSPATGYWVPLAPSWVISEKYGVVATLRPDHKDKRYHIDILEGVDAQTLETAKQGTIRNGRLVCPETGEDFAISNLRGDRQVDGQSVYGLRLWENDDLVPQSDDVFQERLFCVRWSETYLDDKGKEKSRRHFSSATEADLDRESKVLYLLEQRFHDWQEKGFIPSKRIEPGYNTTQPIRERGWTRWHHLFTARQLLMHGLFLEKFNQLYGNDPIYCTAACLSVGSAINRLARLCGVDPHISKGPGSTNQVFTNQALNPQYIYGSRAIQGLEEFYKRSLSSNLDIRCSDTLIDCKDARENSQICDLWITDPPYADAVHYHELSEFFLSWYEGNFVPDDFPEFHWKSLTADERLYLKGVELEKHGELRNGAYQELAKGFGVREYNFMYAKTKSNEARFKTGSEFKQSNLKGDGFDKSLLRHLLFAIHETVNKDSVREGLNYLKVEVTDYWSVRKRAVEILRYLSRLEHLTYLPHWKKDAEAARVLAGAVENDCG